MDATEVRAPDALEGLLLPPGTRLLHIGPPKTGTSAIQWALWNARQTLPEQGVVRAGRTRNPAQSAQAVTNRYSPLDGKVPPMRYWDRLVQEVTRARADRVVISSEHFVWAETDAIQRIRADLDPGRLHVVVTLRPLARLLSSNWQQIIQAGGRDPFDTFLDLVFNPGPGQPPHPFWSLQRHDQLIDRWASVVGAERVTAVVLDDRDHDWLFRVFEGLLGLRVGTLQPDTELSNRSLTLAEVEAIRGFNLAYPNVPRAVHLPAVRAATRELQHRTPDPAEPRITVPDWALERASAVATEIAAGIEASGVRVVGDLDLLLASVPARGDEPAGPVAIPADVAAAMAMGFLSATRAARRFGRPPRRFARLRRLVRRLRGR